MNYAAIAKKVRKQLASKGAVITITRPGDASGWTQKFDITTGEYYWEDGAGNTTTTDPAVSESYETVALIEPASAGAIQAFDIRVESGTLIESNLRALTIAAHDLPIIPGPGDTAVFAGDSWTLLGNTPLLPDGKTYIYHKCTAKRGGV